ncbi:hypothetical protein H2200_010195 [Cladophialophora chaetospira]|uniref:Uncharacterized protein n=1 Tax=Cladophialophora chaetospira TaxID=386627 RepID=A0AA38X2C5_9EURO|nr:hypothetical protein H2200_010195 [Cladophialophora chaetospira]
MSAETRTASAMIHQDANGAPHPEASIMTVVASAEVESFSIQELDMASTEDNGVAYDIADIIDVHVAHADEPMLEKTNASPIQPLYSPISDGILTLNDDTDIGLDAYDDFPVIEPPTPLHFFARDSDGYSVGEALEEWKITKYTRPDLTLEQFLKELAEACGDDVPHGLVQHIQSLRAVGNVMQELASVVNNPTSASQAALTNPSINTESPLSSSKAKEAGEKVASKISYHLDDFPAADEDMPKHFTLKDICEQLPNHVYGTWLDAFIQYFWTAGQIYSFFTDETKELLKKKASTGNSKQVINYLQKRISARWKELGKEGVRKLVARKKIRSSPINAKGEETYGISDPLGLGLNDRAPARNYKRGPKTKA